ncbi:unnamed protein product [Paramecium octaurelia]|uniref:Autophagy-related protein 27 n=1 Tax=Paramecium octaurelia TaxID=43137 RepID=A0A8S1SHI3_PAROT|nr:unnamed protein product [Paramecium octaurelia]
MCSNLTITILVFLIGIASCQQCTWTDESGYTYNLKSLDKPEGWQLKDETSGMGMFSMVYIFNFCDFKPIKCHDRQVGAIEALAVMGQITENCDVAGLVETQAFEHLDSRDLNKGIVVKYTQGDLCMDPKQQPTGVMQPRQAHFFIECGDDDATFTVLPDNECIDQFKIRHHAACRNASSHWFLKFIFIICLYFGGRFIYNRKKLQIEGEDAIPHIHQIKTLIPQVRALFHFGVDRLQTQVQRFRHGGYDSI